MIFGGFVEPLIRVMNMAEWQYVDTSSQYDQNFKLIQEPANFESVDVALIKKS